MVPLNDILAVGSGLTEPWKIVDQGLGLDKEPHELLIRVKADRGAAYPCPECGKPSKAHDLKEFTWRHLNFFQHHCFLTAAVPRVKCEKHGYPRVQVPWGRKGSRSTLLFEQVLAFGISAPQRPGSGQCR